jgi:hypothetical protein
VYIYYIIIIIIIIKDSDPFLPLGLEKQTELGVLLKDILILGSDRIQPFCYEFGTPTVTPLTNAIAESYLACCRARKNQDSFHFLKTKWTLKSRFPSKW